MTTSHSPKAVKFTSARSARRRRWRARVGEISARTRYWEAARPLTKSQPALAEIVEVMVGAAALAASEPALQWRDCEHGTVYGVTVVRIV